MQTASFTNTKNAVPPVEVLTGDLTISKTVSGNAADMKKKFEFTVTFDDAPDAYSYTGNGVTGGIIHSGDKISLTHGQSITITGLPAGAGYHVEEADYSAEKYTVVSVGEEGSMKAKTTQIAAFTNTKQSEPVKPGNGGGGSSNTDVKSPKVPKSDGTQVMPTDPLVNIVTNTPTGNKVGTPEESIITSNEVPKGTKYGKNDGLPKTGDESNSFKSIYGLLLVFAGLSALLLSFMLFIKTRREK